MARLVTENREAPTNFHLNLINLVSRRVSVVCVLPYMQYLKLLPSTNLTAPTEWIPPAYIHVRGELLSIA